VLEAMIFLMTVFLLLGLSSFSQALDLEEIIDGVKFNDSLVESGVGHITCKDEFSIEPKTGLSPEEEAKSWRSGSDKEVFFAFEGEKARCDVKYVLRQVGTGKEVQVKHEESFDGEKTMIFKYNIYGRVIQAVIQSKKYFLTAYDPRIWSMPIIKEPPIPLASLLKKQTGGDIKVTSVSLLGNERLGNDTCYKILVVTDKGKIKLWINPNKGYRPQKIEQDEETPMKRRMITLVTLHQYPNNVWFPSKIVHRTYAFDKRSNNYKLSSTKTIVIHDDFKINVDVPDELFEIQFPKGVKVYDRRIGGFSKTPAVKSWKTE
jgi:outer membrane lipoprotein-sorting protein